METVRRAAQIRHRVRGIGALGLLLVGVTVPGSAPRAQDTTAVAKDRNRALVLIELGRFGQAIALFQKAIAADSNNGSAFEDLGAVYAFAGQAPNAMAAWRRALQLNPKLVWARTNLGNAYTDTGELDSAIVEHRRVIELDSTSPNGYIDLGAALEKKGLDDDAIAQFKRAIALNPHSPIGWYNLGYTSYKVKRWPDAYAALLAAVDLDPAYPDAWELLSSMSQLASPDLELQARKEPRDALAHFYLGLARAFGGDWEIGMNEFDQALDLDRSNPDIYQMKAQVYWYRGKKKQAVQVLQDCVAAVPSSWH